MFTVFQAVIVLEVYNEYIVCTLVLSGWSEESIQCWRDLIVLVSCSLNNIFEY